MPRERVRGIKLVGRACLSAWLLSACSPHPRGQARSARRRRVRDNPDVPRGPHEEVWSRLRPKRAGMEGGKRLPMSLH